MNFIVQLELDGYTFLFYIFKKYYRKTVYTLLYCIYYLENYIFQELEVNYVYNNVYTKTVLLMLFYFQYFLLQFI
jgi:hypothetical protein